MHNIKQADQKVAQLIARAMQLRHDERANEPSWQPQNGVLPLLPHLPSSSRAISPYTCAQPRQFVTENTTWYQKGQGSRHSSRKQGNICMLHAGHLTAQ